LIAFASEKINQDRSHAFAVGGAPHDEERNVDQATISRVISDGVDAKAFDIPFGVARHDDLLTLTECRGATSDDAMRTINLPPFMLCHVRDYSPNQRIGPRNRFRTDRFD
jgi:hypothetical protein